MPVVVLADSGLDLRSSALGAEELSDGDRGFAELALVWKQKVFGNLH